MHAFIRHQLSRYTERLAELDFLLAQPDVMADMTQFMKLSREHTEVAAVAGRWARYQRCEADLAAAQEMLADPDMADMAREEVAACQAEMAALEAELQRMLLPKDPDDARPAFVEIRAGTGGDESALFAGDLARMYTRYAQAQGWRVEVMSESPAELGGYKEVVLRMEGDGAYGQLRFESGGHRVQRVPATETQGRIHTSAATVAVMPEPDEAEAITLNPADLRIDTFRASGAGGQHINKTDSAVRVVHLPTGMVAECQDGRSQHANKAKALQVLQARLQEKERSERAAKEAATRKGLIGSGDRSDRIRTYNFPQGRLTDHRINLTLYKLALVMDGDLADVLDALQAAREAEQVAEQNIKTPLPSDVIVEMPPLHGRVEIKREPRSDDDGWVYHPDPGFVGTDKATFVVKAQGRFIRVVALFKVGFFTEEFERKNPCVPYGWVISGQEEGSDNTAESLVAWFKQGETSALLSSALGAVSGFATWSGSTLGTTDTSATGGVITLDADGAGYGWYADATPLNNTDDFLPTADEGIWIAKPGSAAEGKMDLLSVSNVQPGVMGRREFVFPHEVAGNGPPNDAGNDEPEHAARSANLQCVVDTQPLDEIRHPCQRGTDTPDQRHGADQ